MMQAMRLMNVGALTVGSVGTCESFIPNSVYTQCIRWKRKPIWLPIAKSKMFRVPKKPVIPVEDHKELQRLYNNYRTYMTSLRAHIRQITKENKVEYNKEIIKQIEEEDFRMCNVINDKWNAEIAKKREIRLAKTRELKEEHILYSLLQEEKKKEEQMKRIDEEVKKAKEESVTFITAKNIDAAIEECLANVVDHNRALDLEGNWHEGQYPSILTPEETKTPTAAEQ